MKRTFAQGGYPLILKIHFAVGIGEDEGQRIHKTDRERRMGASQNTWSHWQYKHPIQSGVVTVSGKPNVDIPVGTLHSALKQATYNSGV